MVKIWSGWFQIFGFLKTRPVQILKSKNFPEWSGFGFNLKKIRSEQIRIFNIWKISGAERIRIFSFWKISGAERIRIFKFWKISGAERIRILIFGNFFGAERSGSFLDYRIYPLLRNSVPYFHLDEKFRKQNNLGSPLGVFAEHASHADLLVFESLR